MITAETIIQTKFGDFHVCYHETNVKTCISFSQGNLKTSPIVRIHSSCLFGEAFFSHHCDCLAQLEKTMALINKAKNGIIIYSYAEGRGIGLKNKIRAMEIERTQHCDTVVAFEKIGLKKADYRTYDSEISALLDLKCSQMIKTFSGNPHKISALKNAGFTIKKIIHPTLTDLSDRAKQERLTKETKRGYKY